MGKRPTRKTEVRAVAVQGDENDWLGQLVHSVLWFVDESRFRTTITTLLPRVYIPWHKREKWKICSADEG